VSFARKLLLVSPKYKGADMKKLLVLLLVMGVAFGAYAQAKINRGGAIRSFRPRTTIIAVAPVLPYYSMGYGARYGYRFSPFYDPFYDPFYSSQRFESKPSELDLEIEDIKNDFDYKIDNVKDDEALSKQDKKQRVRDLKHQRDDAIIEAKKKFYSKDDSSSK
jgi:hypothetical protein